MGRGGIHPQLLNSQFPAVRLAYNIEEDFYYNEPLNIRVPPDWVEEVTVVVTVVK